MARRCMASSMSTVVGMAMPEELECGAALVAAHVVGDAGGFDDGLRFIEGFLVAEAQEGDPREVAWGTNTAGASPHRTGAHHSAKKDTWGVQDPGGFDSTVEAVSHRDRMAMIARRPARGSVPWARGVVASGSWDAATRALRRRPRSSTTVPTPGGDRHAASRFRSLHGRRYPAGGGGESRDYDQVHESAAACHMSAGTMGIAMGRPRRTDRANSMTACHSGP